MSDINDKFESIRTIYKENWAQHRAGVNERLYFTYIYVVLFSAILAFFKDFLGQARGEYLLYFLMALSIFGFFFTLKVQVVLRARENFSKKLLEALEITDLDYSKEFNKLKTFKSIPIGQLFPVLFSFFFAFLFYILLDLKVKSCNWIKLAPFIPFIIISFYLLRRKFRYELDENASSEK